MSYEAGFVGDAEELFESLIRAHRKFAGEPFGTDADVVDGRLDRINSYVRKEPYRRTRLMLAIAYDNWPLAHQLLDCGADPFRLSSPTESVGGDHGSAILFVVQRYRKHFLEERFDHCTECIRLIDRIVSAAKGSEAKDVISLRTSMKRISALSEAIRSTDPTMVQLLLQVGADVRMPLGGDDIQPVYFALSEIHVRAIRRVHGANAAISFKLRNARVMSQHMASTAALGYTADEEITEYLRRSASTEVGGIALRESLAGYHPESDGDEDRLLSIVEMLLRNGADPDYIENNGFSPLGFCQEIAEVADNVGDEAASILTDHGAKVLMRWTDFL